MVTSVNDMQLARVRRRLVMRGEASLLTPQEVEMLTDLMAGGPCSDVYLADAVALARYWEGR